MIMMMNNNNNIKMVITNEANAKDEYFCNCKSVSCSPLYTPYRIDVDKVLLYYW